MKPTLRTTVAADGTLLAFRVQGQGPAIVFTNGYTTTADYFSDLIQRLQRRATLITWDLKGHGDSGPARSPEGVTIEAAVDDLRRVMDAANVQTATLAAFSMGCQIILEAWRHIPQRIDALIPMLGMGGKPFDTLVHPRVGPLLYHVLKRGQRAGTLAMRAAWLGTRLPTTHALNKLSGMIGPEVSRDQMRGFYDHFKRIHGPSWAAMGVAAQRHSALDLLHTIEKPTLVVSGGRDLFTPAHLSRDLADAIPGAEHLHIPRATHAGLFEYPDLIGDRFTRFLLDRNLILPAE